MVVLEPISGQYYSVLRPLYNGVKRLSSYESKRAQQPHDQRHPYHDFGKVKRLLCGPPPAEVEEEVPKRTGSASEGLLKESGFRVRFAGR